MNSAAKLPSLSQIQGSIIGLAVADAVAAPWEGMMADMIRSMGPAERIVAHESAAEIYYTDDTQMMIGVAQTLVEHGEIKRDTLMQKFVDNYHPDRGYGQGARKIINAAGFGEDWDALAADLFDGTGSLGNGGAMRVAPLGVFFSNDFEQAAIQGAKSAEPTHRHEIGIDATRLLAVAAAMAARSIGDSFNREYFLNELRTYAQTEEFQWQIDLALQLDPFESLVSFGSSLEANKSVMTSILCFAGSPDSYTDAVTRAIGQGDDVDTLAAMTAGLSGARLGIEGVPTHLIKCLEDSNQGKTYLFELAEQLFQKCCE